MGLDIHFNQVKSSYWISPSCSELSKNKQNIQSERKKTKNALTAIGMIALGTIVLGGLIYYAARHRNIFPKKPDFDKVAIKENFERNKEILTPSLGGIQYNNFRFNEHLANPNEDMSTLELLFAMEESFAHKNIFGLPKIMCMQGLKDSNLKFIGEALAEKFDTDFIHRRYRKGHAKEFCTAIEDMLLSEEKKITFMAVDNLGHFFEEIGSLQNKSILEKFDTAIHQKRGLIILTNYNYDRSKIPIRKYLLSFKAPLEKEEIDANLLKYSFAIKNKKIVDNIYDDLEKCFCGNLWHVISELLNVESEMKALLIADGSKGDVNCLIDHITQKTGHKFFSIRLNPNDIEESEKQLQSIFKKNSLDFDLSGKKTFMHIENFDELGENKDKIISIFDNQTGTTMIAITEDTTIKDKFVSTLLIPKKQIQLSQELEMANKKLKEAGVPEQISKRLFDEFIKFIIFEKFTQNKCRLVNGILLNCDKEINSAILKMIKLALDKFIYFKEVKFDSNSPLKVLNELNKLAKFAEEQYQKNGKRTIIELKDFDKFLTGCDNKTIAIFKSFCQDVEQKYHTTLILQTDQDLNNFETASISTERLGGIIFK